MTMPTLTSTLKICFNDVSIEIRSPLRKRAKTSQIPTPKKGFNGVSIEIILPPRKCAKTVQIRATLKSSKDCLSKGDIIKKHYRKHMEENVYVFAKHKILPEIKRIYCCGDNAREAHVCILDENSWVDFSFGKILEETGFNLSLQLAREWLLEHFRKKNEVDSAISTSDSFAEGG